MTRARRMAAWVAAWSCAIALLWLAMRGADWRAALVSGRHARPALLLGAVAANLAILVLWASLWRTLLPRGTRLGYRRMLEIVTVTSAIMNTIPALVGHASAAALLVKRGQLPVRTAGSIIALDQVGEGLSKLAVIALALAVVDLPSWMIGAAVSVGALVVALIAGVAAVGHFGGRHLGDTRAGRILNGVRADLQVLREPRRAAAAVAVALAMKAAEALAIACVMLALHIDLPLTGAVVVLAAVNLATMLPVSPGNIGTYEAGAAAAYRWMGVSPEAALAAAVLQHACFLLPAVGAGAVALALNAGAVARGPLTAPGTRAS